MAVQGTLARNPLRWQGKGMQLQVNGPAYPEYEVQDPRSIPRRDLVSKSSPDVARSQLSIQFDALATATPLLVTENSPFGSGFIGWGLVPGLHSELENCPFVANLFPCLLTGIATTIAILAASGGGKILAGNGLLPHATCDDGTPMTLVLDQRT
jgi:hypothetical protein